MVEIDFTKTPEAGAIKRHILERYRKGLLTITLVIGGGGTGKSYSSLRLGEILSQDIKAEFNIENVVDNLLALLKFIRTHSHCILIIEEGSILFSSRRSMTDENVIVNKIVDSLRKKQIICIINFPIAKTIDSHILHMSNMLLETLLINKTKGYVLVKPLILQTNVSSGKTYYHKLQDNKGYDISLSYFLKPTEELCKMYEGKKDEFLDTLYTQLEAKHMKKLDKSKVDLGLKPKSNTSFTARELQVYELFYRQHKKKADIARELRVSAEYISNVVNKIRIKAEFSKKNDTNPIKSINKSDSPINLNYYNGEKTTDDK